MTKFNEGGPESIKLPPELSLKEYEDIAGFDENDFKEDWRREASIYREILWALITEYTDGQCEMTHSEFIKDKKTGEVEIISLCMTIFEDSGCDFQGFADYIKKNIDLIPEKLRKTLIVYIGYNYGDKGGVKIKGNEINYINQNVVDSEALESDGKIGYGAGSKTKDKLEKIYHAVVEKIKESNKSGNT